MDAETVIPFAARWWPQFVSPTAAAQPVAQHRLSDLPLWRIDDGGSAFALRAWPNERLPQATAAARFVRAAEATNLLKLPIPIPLSQNSTSFLASDNKCGKQNSGHHWELTPWLAGEASFAEQPSLAKLCAMCRTLATLHESTRRLDARPKQPAMKRYIEQVISLQQCLLAGDFDAVRSELRSVLGRYGSAASPDALLSGGRIALSQLQALRGARLPQQWVWGDAWHSNFLFVGDRVSGLVDFATVRIDSPAADLARLLGSTTSGQAAWWDEGLSAYQSVRPLSPAEIAATAAIRDVGTVLSLANWLRWLGIERRSFISRDAAHARLLHFAERLNHLLERSDL